MSASFLSSKGRPFLFALGLVAAGAVALTAFESTAQTTAPKPAQPATQQKPAQQSPAARPSEASANAATETQPVAHARSASLSTCLPALSELSRLTVDAPHAAVSIWNKSAANDHSFSSIVGLKYANETAPQAVSILTVAPNKAQRCDGSSVQVQPSKLACEVIAKNLTSSPKNAAVDMNGVIIVQGDGPLRVALVPTSGNGCAVVGISTYFARP